MAEKRIKSEQTFDYDTVTAIIYCMLKDGVVLGARHYETMSALSGTRTASAFQHDFRDAKRRAKDLLVKGDVLGPKNKDDDNSTELKNGKKATAKSTGKRGNMFTLCLKPQS
jgi:hypothetical protein